MFKLLFIFAILSAGVSHSKGDEILDHTQIRLPKCSCNCRTTRFAKIITRRRCRRQRSLCRLRRCTRRGRRGIRCCKIFKLVKDDDAVDVVDTGDTVAAPYPPLGGSCGGSNVVNNFFGALTLNDGTSLTRVKIAFCVASRVIGERLFNGVVDAINRRFDREIVRNLKKARKVIREEAVIADAFALGYYNPV